MNELGAKPKRVSQDWRATVRKEQPLFLRWLPWIPESLTNTELAFRFEGIKMPDTIVLEKPPRQGPNLNLSSRWINSLLSCFSEIQHKTQQPTANFIDAENYVCNNQHYRREAGCTFSVLIFKRMLG